MHDATIDVVSQPRNRPPPQMQCDLRVAFARAPAGLVRAVQRSLAAVHSHAPIAEHGIVVVAPPCPPWPVTGPLPVMLPPQPATAIGQQQECGSASVRSHGGANRQFDVPRPGQSAADALATWTALIRNLMPGRATPPPRRPRAGRAPPCGPRRRARPARGSPRAGRRRRRGSISTPRLIGPGCITIASGFASASRAASGRSSAQYSRVFGNSAPAQALVLDAQHHHDVGAVERGLDAVVARSRARSPSLDAARHQRARRREPDPRAELRRGADVRARDARVRDVAADRDLEPVDASLVRGGWSTQSSSACVGCSCVPSPALMTAAAMLPGDAARPRPTRGGAPRSRRACIASRLRAVSSSVSPLVVDELEPRDVDRRRRDSRLAASSNEVRVRVEGSKNRLMTVLPAQRRHLLDRAGSAISRNRSPRSRTITISAAESGSMPSRWRGGEPGHARRSRSTTRSGSPSSASIDPHRLPAVVSQRPRPTKSGWIGSSRRPRSTSTASSTARGRP